MAYTFEVNHAKHRVFVVGRDPVGLPDVLALLDRQVDEHAWSYAALHDARLVTWLPSSAEIRQIVAYIDATSRTHGPRGSVAFVVSDATLFGMARMYSEIAEGTSLEFQFFRDPAVAERWLHQKQQA